jgi:uncharacterized protein (DUF1778 family)
MDEDLLDAVRQAAEDEHVTLSAFLAEAARHRVALLGLGRLLDDWERENGAFTEEELAEAREWLDNPLQPDEVLRQAEQEQRKKSA